MRLRIFLAAVLAIVCSEFYGQAISNSGFVFIDGKYIDAPYHVHTKDLAVYINGHQITEPLEWPVVNKSAFAHDPGQAPAISKYTGLEEASKMREPSSNVLYHAAKQWYLFSHFSYDEAMQKSIEYFENLPNVKSLTLLGGGLAVMEGYNGEKRNIVIGGADMEYMNAVWGPNGSGPPSKQELINEVEGRAKRYKDRLDKGDLFLIHGPDNEVSYAERKAALLLPELLKVMKGSISEAEKESELISIGLIPCTESKEASSFVKNYKTNKKLEKRVEGLIQRVEKEFGPQGELKRNSDQLMREYKEQRYQQGGINSLKAAGGAYSPDGSAVYGGCPYTYEPGFHYAAETQPIIDDIKDQDFNATITTFKDDTQHDNNTGTYTYANFKSMKYADLLYWTCHGGRSSVLYVLRVQSKAAVNAWSGNDSLNIVPFENTSKNWPTGHPWYGVAWPTWATTFWSPLLTQSKAITILSCCYSHQNGWAAACGGGATFGYDTTCYSANNITNDRELLQRMSGKKGNGNFRKAGEAFNNMPAHLDLFRIVPANAQITLAPGTKDYLPKDGDLVLDNGTGYFEVDTWCHSTIPADQALTFATSGNVTISNVHWEGTGEVKKVVFDWTGNACWEVTVTVHHDKWHSWGAASTTYHKLDVNRKTPNTEDGEYTFYSLDTLDLSMSKTDVKCKGGSDGTATVTVTNGTPPYTYQWSPSGGAGATASGLKAGTYKVIVTDANYCHAQKSIIVSEPTKLNLSLSGGGSIPYCIQDGPPSITLTAVASGGTPPYTYSWPGGTKTVSSSGTYTCNVTDDNGCVATKRVKIWFIAIVCSRDPNDIAGPIGYEPGQWVSVNDQMPYTIRFENDPDFATAPAQVVTVNLPFDDNLNPFSFRLGDFGFANFIFSVPQNSIFYSQRLDVVDSLGVYVDIVAGIDVNTNEAFWIFESIDPTTGLPPTDALTGFLPVNDSIFHRGEGFVSYTVMPKTTSQTGDSVFATAEIVFDINEPIVTNTWENIIDAVPPTSVMDPLPAFSTNLIIPLSWTAQDDIGGVGVGSYDLFFSKDGGPITLYIAGLDTSYLDFTAENNSSYSFYVIAIDHTGNREANKTAPDVSITVGAPTLELTLPGMASVYCVGSEMQIEWDAMGINEIHIDISNDAGVTYTNIAASVDATLEAYLWQIPSAFQANNNCLIRLSTALMEYVATSDPFMIKDLPTVNLGPNLLYGLPDLVTIDAGSGFSSYEWSNAETTQQLSFYGFDLGIGTFTFTVTVTDSYSCSGTGSVDVEIEGGDTCYQSIDLPVNWSIFSTNVNPFEPDMVDLTTSISSFLILVKNEQGAVYWPYFQLNDIGDLLLGKGYLIKLSTAASLAVEGECIVPEIIPISLLTGWNMIGYLRQNPASVVSMLSTISSSVILVKNSQGSVYWPFFTIDQIGNMNPGEGYQIKMFAPETYYYPANSTPVSKVAIHNPPSDYFGKAIHTGTNMTLGIPLSAWAYLPARNDEIGVFDPEGILVGSGVFDGGNMAISVWGNDEYSDQADGIKKGDKFTMRIWKKSSGSVSDIIIHKWMEGDNIYSENKIAIADKLLVAGLDNNTEAILHQNVPNPFKGNTEISFYLPGKMQVELALFNALGDKLIELIPATELSEGIHKYELDAKSLSTGTYFYRLSTPEKTITKALNLIN